MSSRLTRAAVARDRAYRDWRDLPVTATHEDLVQAHRRMLDADARWREELERVAAGKGAVAA